MEDQEKYRPIEIVRRLFEKDYENKVCVECKSPMPSYVSINNAILLCDQCAQRHMSLGYNVSYIRHITSDWDAYLYTYMDRGGNSRFIRLSKKYDLDNMPIEQKFNTRILEYYRLLIKSEVLADVPPFEIPYEVAKDPINNNVIYFPEFQNYQIYEGKIKPEKNKSGYLEAFRYIGRGLGSMASYLASKYQEYDMNNKLLKGGGLAAQGLAGAGKLLYKNVAKPAIKGTLHGIGNLFNMAANNFSDENNEKDNNQNNNQGNNQNNNQDNNIIINQGNSPGNIQINNQNNYPINNQDNYPINNQNNYPINNQDNNQINNNLYPMEGNYNPSLSQSLPSYESVIRINEQQNNNNDIINTNNININNFNENNFQNNFNQNVQNINNQIPKPNYVIPPGLDSSSLDNSIVGEK